MTDHFDKWINGMSEQQYEDWLNDEATDNQEAKALNLREPLSETEMQEMEREQEYDEPKLPQPKPSSNKPPKLQQYEALQKQQQVIPRKRTFFTTTRKGTKVISTTRKEIDFNPVIKEQKKQSVFRRFVNRFRRR